MMAMHRIYIHRLSMYHSKSFSWRWQPLFVLSGNKMSGRDVYNELGPDNTARPQGFREFG